MKKNNWKLFKMIESKPDKTGRKAAVELQYQELRDFLVFSYTPFLITKEGDEIPVMHLRGDLITEYIVLLEEAARFAQRMSARWDSENKRERLTANLFEHLREKS